MESDMMDLIKKHITLFVIITIVAALILPIFINALHLIGTDFEILHKPSEWTMFWSSYLGAIISAVCAFIILHIQRKDNEYQNNNNRIDNEKQNEENRIENEKQNNANRQLQLNILKYQQQSRWLDKFRDVSLEYCNALNCNDIVLITNTIWEYPNEAFGMLKPLFDRIIETNTKFSFIRKQSPKANELAKCLDDTYIAYKQVLNDLQWIAIYFRTNIPDCRYQDGFIKFLQLQKRTRDDMNHILELSQQVHYSVNHKKYFDDIIKEIVCESKKYEPNVRDKIYEYIKQEQESIDNILVDDIKQDCIS